MKGKTITIVCCNECDKLLYTIDEENGNIVEIRPHETIYINGETVELCEDCLHYDECAIEY